MITIIIHVMICMFIDFDMYFVNTILQLYIRLLNVFSLFYELYSHMYVKTVFIILQAFRRYKISWANKDLNNAFILYSYMYCIIFQMLLQLIMDSANRGQGAVQIGRNDSEINHWLIDFNFLPENWEFSARLLFGVDVH